MEVLYDSVFSLHFYKPKYVIDPRVNIGSCVVWWLRLPACCAEGPGYEPQVVALDFSKLTSVSSLSIAFSIKLEGCLCSVFYAEASKRPWTSLNE